MLRSPIVNNCVKASDISCESDIEPYFLGADAVLISSNMYICRENYIFHRAKRKRIVKKKFDVLLDKKMHTNDMRFSLSIPDLR